MPRTAEVTFRVLDAATRPMEKIVKVGKQDDTTMEGANKSIRNLDSSQNRSPLDNAGRNVEQFGAKTIEMERNVNRSTDKAGRHFERMRDCGAKSMEELTGLIKRFE